MSPREAGIATRAVQVVQARSPTWSERSRSTHTQPTASLDKKSGREVVEILRGLARERGASVVLVTHDARILDVADRILHLEDGRLVSFGDAVLASTRHLMGLFAEMSRRGELDARLRGMHPEEFAEALERVTREAEHFLRVSGLAQSDAFEGLREVVARKLAKPGK